MYEIRYACYTRFCERSSKMLSMEHRKNSVKNYTKIWNEILYNMEYLK